MSARYAGRPLRPDAAAVVRDNADLSVDPASPRAAAIVTRIMAAIDASDVAHLEVSYADQSCYAAQWRELIVLSGAFVLVLPGWSA
ncbi:hypothetical protein [Kibdelosporangium persicum]|uniref:hypothetical protein n=1 Tax=Kibdelosporangium persicum TaxID=2698649 RepID=UPI0039EFCA99